MSSIIELTQPAVEPVDLETPALRAYQLTLRPPAGDPNAPLFAGKTFLRTEQDKAENLLLPSGRREFGAAEKVGLSSSPKTPSRTASSPQTYVRKTYVSRFNPRTTKARRSGPPSVPRCWPSSWRPSWSSRT